SRVSDMSEMRSGKTAVIEYREAAALHVACAGIEFGDNNTRCIAGIAEDAPPGIDDAAVAPGAAAAAMRATLIGRQNVAEVLHRTRAQQHLPVRLAGARGER